jgi:hypothetical protein
MNFREDQLVKTSTNRSGRSTILVPDQTSRAIGRIVFTGGHHEEAIVYRRGSRLSRRPEEVGSASDRSV